METQDTESPVNKFVSVNRTSDGFTVTATETVAKDLLADITPTTENVTKSEILPVVPMDVDAEASDQDEVVSLDDEMEIFTASQFVKPAELEKEKSVVSPQKIFEDRPDYSSTTSESHGEGFSPTTDAKFFLSSDIPAGTKPISTTSLGNHSKATQRLVLDKSTYGKSTVSENYTRCVNCLRHHQHCDRSLPKCSKCMTESDCVYLKKGVYDTVTKTVRAWETASGTKQRSISRSIIPERKPSIDTRIDERASKPVAQASPRQIFWIDGDISNSQRSCPKSIVRLITKHMAEFEQDVLAMKWPPDRTIDSDRGRIVFHIFKETNEKIPLARYHYGKNSQFFVAWIPGETANDAPEPTICKFLVYNGLVIEREGQSWRAITWKTWAPKGVPHKTHTIYRCVPEKGSGRLTTSTDPATHRGRVSEPATDQLTGYASSDNDNKILHRSASTMFNRPFSGADGSLKRKRAESIDMDEPGPSEIGYISLRGLPNSLGRLSSHVDSTHNPHATRSSARLSNGRNGSRHGVGADTERDGPSTAVHSNQYIVQKPKKVGPNLTCIFRDKDGHKMGIYPYDECDTAQKLFDVACVAQIAQIEPPATRLLKISFDGGGEGRLRPDNQNDFMNIFETELAKLMSKDGTNAWTVMISPYL